MNDGITIHIGKDAKEKMLAMLEVDVEVSGHERGYSKTLIL